jgi:phosphomannomutase/phosphoglucomutase
LLFDDIKQKGGNPIMWKTGHSLIKAKLKETNGALAGEMSGHIFFNNRFFGFDDAVYASARLIEILSKTDKKTSELLADLPKTVSTPEIRVDCPEEVKFKIPELVKEAFKAYEVDTTDGARIRFEKGWGLVRASNTQPVLVMRFEAQSEAELKKYQTLVEDTLNKIKSSI